jgi:hypothetical protein
MDICSSGKCNAQGNRLLKPLLRLENATQSFFAFIRETAKNARCFALLAKLGGSERVMKGIRAQLSINRALLDIKRS